MILNNKWVHFRPLYANTAKNLLRELQVITLRKILCDQAERKGLEERFSKQEMNSWNSNESCVKSILLRLHPETYVMFEWSQNYQENNQPRIDMCLLGMNEKRHNAGAIYLLELKAWDETSFDDLSKDRGHPYEQIKSYYRLVAQFLATIDGPFQLYGGVCLFNFNGTDAIVKNRIFKGCGEQTTDFAKTLTHLVINDQIYNDWVDFLANDLLIDGNGQKVYNRIFHPLHCPNSDFYHRQLTRQKLVNEQLTKDIQERDWIIEQLSLIISKTDDRQKEMHRELAGNAINSTIGERNKRSCKKRSKVNYMSRNDKSIGKHIAKRDVTKR